MNKPTHSIEKCISHCKTNIECYPGERDDIQECIAYYLEQLRRIVEGEENRIVTFEMKKHNDLLKETNEREPEDKKGLSEQV